MLFCSEATCSDGVMKSRLFSQPEQSSLFLTVTGFFVPLGGNSPLFNVVPSEIFCHGKKKKNVFFYSLKFYGYLTPHTQAYHTQKLKC